MMTDSDQFPVPSDPAEDYAQHGYGASDSLRSQHDEQFMKNEQFQRNEQFLPDEQYVQDEQFVQNVQNEVLNELNGSIPQPAEENNLLWPVLPGESGEGLPYAPIDWPYPGDIWTWRVGKRYTTTGYFQDRFLYVPKRLGKQSFASKNAVANYIKAEFPDADIDAFFASFAWKIPVKVDHTAKDEPVPVPWENPTPDEKDMGQEEKKEEDLGRRKRRKSEPAVPPELQEKQNGDISSSRPKRTRPIKPKPPPPPQPTPTPKRTRKAGAKSASAGKQTNQDSGAVSSTPKRKTRQSRQAAHNDGGGAFNEPIVDPIPEDFDNYLNSLEDIISQPVTETQAPTTTTTDSSIVLNDMVEARERLSSLLAMDFPSLVSSNYTFELASLASKLRKDPTLNAEQLVKLKLVEEITSFSEVFLESRELIEQVDEFFATLEARKTKVASLKSEYNELKEKADQLQAQMDSNAMTVQEIDNQIALLQSRRAELTSAIQTNKAAKVEVNSAQKMVASAIPKVVQEIQLANAKTPELDLKKTNALKREAEILAKFAPLHGFSL